MKILKKPLLKFLSYTIIILVVKNPIVYADEPDNQEEQDTPIAKVLSVATGDWNEDERIDSAVLMKTNEIVELYLYLNNKENEQELVLHKKDVVWSGAMEGTEPYLKPKNKSASLFIHSENDSIGRNRWHQRLTISYRDEAFIVTGYTYDDRDTLDPQKGFSCDVNLVTGKGFKDKKEFKIAGQKIKLEDWTQEHIPKQCIAE
ncbi:MAG: hypothetical protein GQ569_13260 [Methylococcaceae bacterium]|nr:hypothetical protein [Methylococcaceae bacterium]